MKNSKKFLLTAVSLASCSVFLLDTYFPVFAQDPIEDTQPTTEDPSYVELYSNYLGQLKTFADSYKNIEPSGGLILSTAVNLAVLPCMLLAIFQDWFDKNYAYDYTWTNPSYTSCCYKNYEGKIHGATFRSLIYSEKNTSPIDNRRIPVLSTVDGNFGIGISTYYDRVSFNVTIDSLSFVSNIYKSAYQTETTDYSGSHGSIIASFGNFYNYKLEGFKQSSNYQSTSVSSYFYLPNVLYSDRFSYFFIPSDYTPVTVDSQDFDFNNPGIIIDKVVSGFESQYPDLVDDPHWKQVVDDIPEFPNPGDYYDIRDPLLPALPDANTLPTLPNIDPSESSIIQPMLQGSKTLFGLIGSFIKDSGLLPWILIIVICSVAWFFLRW